MAIGDRFPLAVLLGGENRLTGPLSKAQKDLLFFGKSASRIGKRMTVGLTLPLVAMGAAAVKSGSDFQFQMNRVRALSGETAAALVPLGKQARILGKQTQFTAAQAAEGLTFLAQKGFDVIEMSKSAAPVLDLAAAANESVADSAMVASGALRGFRKDASEMRPVADVLAKTIASSGTNLIELGEALKDSAPASAQARIAMTETAAVIGKMADNMIIGTRAGTAFKRGIVNLTAFGPRVEKAFSRLGIRKDQIQDSEGNINSLINVLDLLERKGAKTIDFIDIFGERAFVAFAAASGQGVDAIKLLKRELDEAQGLGFVSKQAGILMEGTRGDMLRLIASAENLGIALGESGLLSRASELLQFLTRMADKVAKLSPDTQRFGLLMLGAAALAGPLIFAVGTLATALGSLAAITGVAIGKLVLIGGAVAAVVGGVAAARGFIVDAWNHIAGGIGGAARDILGWLGRMRRALIPDWLMSLLGSGGTFGGGLGASGRTAAVEDRLNRAIAAGPGAAAAGQANVRVELPNVPRGSRVSQSADNVDLELDVGVALISPA